MPGNQFALETSFPRRLAPVPGRVPEAKRTFIAFGNDFCRKDSQKQTGPVCDRVVAEEEEEEQKVGPFWLSQNT